MKWSFLLCLVLCQPIGATLAAANGSASVSDPEYLDEAAIKEKTKADNWYGDTGSKRVSPGGAPPEYKIRPGDLRNVLASIPIDQRIIRIHNTLICDPGKGPCTQRVPSEPNELPQIPPEHNDCTLDLRDLHINVAVDLSGNDFRCNLALGGAHFDQTLNLDDTTLGGRLDAHGLRVDGSFTMVGSVAWGKIDADGMRIGGTVNLHHATVRRGSLYMRGAAIGGHLDLGEFYMSGEKEPRQVEEAPPRASVRTPRSGVDISNAQVGRHLYLTGAKILKSDADLSGIEVLGSVWMEKGTTSERKLTLERARIQDSLFMGEGQFNQVDLTSAQIIRELRLESNSGPALWRGGRYGHNSDHADGKAVKLDNSTWLTLRNARIGGIRDTTEAWPDCLTLDGLSYGSPPFDYSLPSVGNALEARKKVNTYRWCRTEVKQPDGWKGAQQQTATGCEYANLDWAKETTCFIITERNLIGSNPLCKWTWIGPILSCDSSAESEPRTPRSPVWWTNWLMRDSGRTEASYKQLILSLDMSGKKTDSEAVSMVLRNFSRGHEGWPKWVVMWCEEVFVGFGIGVYALICTLFWTLALSGTVSYFLHKRVHGLLNRPGSPHKFGRWACFGACVMTMIPVVSVPKSMDEFLHAPVNPRDRTTVPVSGGLIAAFVLLSLAGWALSALLLHGLVRFFDL